MTLSHTTKNHKLLILTLLLIMGGIMALMMPATMHAETPRSQYDYAPLAPLPDFAEVGSSTVQTNDLSRYVLNLYMIILSLSGVLAVFMITYGGIKVMTTDAFEGKREGKEIIKHTVWGLILMMASYLILYTIDPKIFDLKVHFKEIKTQTTVTSGGALTEAQRQETRNEIWQEDLTELVKTNPGISCKWIPVLNYVSPKIIDPNGRNLRIENEPVLERASDDQFGCQQYADARISADSQASSRNLKGVECRQAPGIAGSTCADTSTPPEEPVQPKPVDPNAVETNNGRGFYTDYEIVNERGEPIEIGKIMEFKTLTECRAYEKSHPANVKIRYSCNPTR